MTYWLILLAVVLYAGFVFVCCAVAGGNDRPVRRLESDDTQASTPEQAMKSGLVRSVGAGDGD